MGANPRQILPVAQNVEIVHSVYLLFNRFKSGDLPVWKTRSPKTTTHQIKFRKQIVSLILGVGGTISFLPSSRIFQIDVKKQEYSIMKYLIKVVYVNGRIKVKENTAAHLWNGKDTVCRMASTGGLNLRRYKVFDNTCGKSICKNCLHV